MGILGLHVKTPLHNEGGLLMTELFSEPEQLKRIAEPLSNRSDIYSLGMTLYVLANDKKFPDQRDVLPEIEEISVELNAILRKACSYYPGNRYQSAAELRKELVEGSQQAAFFMTKKRRFWSAPGAA